MNRSSLLIDTFEKLCPEDNSEITMPALKSLARFLDKFFHTAGLEIAFTKHFQKRVNDLRSKKHITLCELREIFHTTFREFADDIRKHDTGYEAVIKDLSTKVNIPFKLEWDGRYLDLISKTVLRKDTFKTTNPIYKLKTEDTYAEMLNNEWLACVENVEIFESAANELSDRNVAKILTQQGSNTGQSVDYFLDRWIKSKRFVLMTIPIDSITPATKPTGISSSKGPIIVDMNIREVGRYKGMFGAAPDIIILDGKNRWKIAKDKGERVIRAYVGEAVIPLMMSLKKEYETRQKEIDELLISYYTSKSPGSARAILEVKLSPDDFQKVKAAFKSFKSGKRFPIELLKRYPVLKKVSLNSESWVEASKARTGANLSVLVPINEEVMDDECDYVEPSKKHLCKKNKPVKKSEEYDEETCYGCFATKKILKITETDDYIILNTIQDGSHFGGKDFEMKIAYGYTGCYLGDEKFGKFLAKRGIVAEAAPGNDVCSIGWSEKDQKYYGWSHRAIFGFKNGDKIFETTCKHCDDKTIFSDHGTKTIKSKADAKQAAINFAEYVS